MNSVRGFKLASPDRDGDGWQVVKLDSTIGSRVGYFGRFRDFSNSDFIMNTAGVHDAWFLLQPAPKYNMRCRL